MSCSPLLDLLNRPYMILQITAEVSLPTPKVEKITIVVVEYIFT